MILHLTSGKTFENRKDLKQFLGGTNAYNRELKNNRLIFNYENIAINEELQSTTKRH